MDDIISVESKTKEEEQNELMMDTNFAGSCAEKCIESLVNGRLSRCACR